jgi:hypothetical protein
LGPPEYKSYIKDSKYNLLPDEWYRYRTGKWYEPSWVIQAQLNLLFNINNNKSDESLPNQPPTTGLKNKIKATFEIEQCRIFVVLWWPFWKWRPVKNFRYFNDISCVDRLLCPELIPDIDKFLPVAIFKMAATVPHKFNLVQFQCPELIPDIENYSGSPNDRLVVGFKTRYDYNLTIMKSPKPATDTIYSHIKFWWYRTMLNFYKMIVVLGEVSITRRFTKGWYQVLLPA